LTFFRMLYGFIPFSGTTIGEVFSRRLHEDLPPREKLDGKVPASVYRIIQIMTARNPDKRFAKYADLVEALEDSRRSILQGTAVMVEPPQTAGAAIRMRGTLYDRPLPEILGEIARLKLSGKLTLSWIDLVKTLHFKQGKIVAVLSNQEGERFYELMQQWHQISGKKAREISESSIDLFVNYSSMMSDVNPDTKNKMFDSIQDLGWRILQGLFSWVVGEFIFEDGNFPAQMMLEISSSDVVTRGVKEWMDFATIRRRLLGGDCKIVLAPDFDNLLKTIQIAPSDAFLLFRFENRIAFQELLNLSSVSEDDFYRLIYLFHCFGILTLEKAEPELPPRKLEKTPVPPKRVAGKKPESIQPQVATPIAAVGPSAGQPSPAAVTPIPAVVAEPMSTFRRKVVEDPGTYYYNCASDSYNNKNYWACVEYCKKALEHKKDPQIYNLMGMAFATHLKFRHEALNAFQKALEIDPRKADIYNNIADLYFFTENYALARANYQKVLKLKPNQHAEERLEEIAQKLKK
jgi:tetratricopeptide (TPR) repeat protein